MKLVAISLIILGLMAQERGGGAAQRGEASQRGGRGGRGTTQPEAPMRLDWIDRTGKVLGTIGTEMQSILDPAISPDGNKVAVRGREKEEDIDAIWVHEGTTKRRVSNNTGPERHMVWSPRGDRFALSMRIGGQDEISNLYLRNADGRGADQPLVVSKGMHKWSPTWSPDARTIVFHTADVTTMARDLWFVNVADGKTGVLMDTPAIEALPRMSQDGRFVAYQSDEGGRMEIWVTTFPKANKWKISTNGGTWAKWGRNEVFYWEGNQLMVVKVSGAGSNFKAEPPQKLFTGAQVGMGASNLMMSYNPEYDVTADGTKFVVSRRVR